MRVHNLDSSLLPQSHNLLGGVAQAIMYGPLVDKVEPSFLVLSVEDQPFLLALIWFGPIKVFLCRQLSDQIVDQTSPPYSIDFTMIPEILVVE